MFCPQCFESLDDDARSCGVCGWEAEAPAVVEHAAPPAEADALVSRWRAQFEQRRLNVPAELQARAARFLAQTKGEMRRASAVFSDLVGFSKQSSEVGGEEIARVIREFQTIALELALLHNGFVVRFMADGIFLMFGAPIAFDRDTENAVECARELVERVKVLTWPDGTPLQARAGVGTGTVHMTLSHEGSEEFLVIGDSVNLAARLEPKARPGGTLVCHATAKAVQHRFEFEPSEPLTLKNMSDGYVAYHVLGERAQPGSARRGDLPFFGRRRELERLTQWLREGGAETREGLVSGEAGIGKSRLIRQAAEELADTHHFITLENTSPGRHVLLYSFIHWLRALLELPATPGTEAVEAAVAAYLEKHPALDGGHGVVAAYVLGSERAINELRQLDGEQLRERLFLALLSIMREEAGGRHLTIVLDDFHWADELTVSWREWVLKRRPENLSVLRLARSEAVDESVEDLTRAQVPEFSIFLTRLEAKAAEELLGAILPLDRLPAHLRQMLVDRSGGNPFYNIELSQALAELLSDGTVEPSEEQLLALLPDSLTDVVQWRVDRLTDHTRRVLQAGSVLGYEFARNLLELIRGVREQLNEDLIELRTRSFLDEVRHLPVQLLRFHHPLSRDVAYQMLLPERRREMHAEVARHLEAMQPVPSADHCDALAWHWRLGGDRKKALLWLSKAGEARTRLGIPREAIGCFSRALEVLGEDAALAAEMKPLRVRLRLQCAKARTDLGDFELAARDIKDATAAAAELNNAPLAAMATVHRHILAVREGTEDNAEELRAMVAKGGLPPAVACHALTVLGLSLLGSGRVKDARECFTQLEALAAEKKIVTSLGDAHTNGALAAWFLGDFDGALEGFRRAIELFRANRCFDSLALALMNSGAVQEKRGEYDAAARLLRNAEELAKKTESRFVRAAVLTNLSNLERVRGNPAEAAEAAAEAVTIADAIGYRTVSVHARINLALARLRQGQAGAALQGAREALDRARPHRGAEIEFLHWARLLKVEARALAERPLAPARGRRLARMCAAVRRRAEAAEGMLELRLHAMLARAEALRACGDAGAKDAAEEAHRAAAEASQPEYTRLALELVHSSGAA